MNIITANNLTKIYQVPLKEKVSLKQKITNFFRVETKDFVALHSTSFKIEKGEFIGYIGPNGAGKSTTIKMLTGIITPTPKLYRIKQM